MGVEIRRGGQRHTEPGRHAQRERRPRGGAATHVLNDQADVPTVGRLGSDGGVDEEALAQHHRAYDAGQARVRRHGLEPGFAWSDVPGAQGVHRMPPRSHADVFQATSPRFQ